MTGRELAIVGFAVGLFALILGLGLLLDWLDRQEFDDWGDA
jgi:hypothetical protein